MCDVEGKEYPRELDDDPQISVNDVLQTQGSFTFIESL